MFLESESPRQYLEDELARRLRTNPRYSLRAFARQLKMSPGELSEVLQGKRGLSARSALKVAQALGLNEGETQRLLYLASRERGQAPAASGAKPAEPSRELTIDLFRVVSDWYCFAILNLADTEGFRFDDAWIARRLGISVLQARDAVQRLERVGLLERKKGKLVPADDYVWSPSGIPSEAIRAHHRQVLEKAIEALDEQRIEEREISGIGLALAPEKFESLRKDVIEFQNRMIKKYSKGRRAEVYQLEMALFRLTKSPSRSDV